MNLTLKNIEKRYDGFSLKNVSFSLPSSSITSIIGNNGAGKTTLMKVVSSPYSPIHPR
ncbi:MAG: ATP-binding cassette domain-containing protein [Oscillospiraceae bacterium]|nr:ATP-binding cassette domain-containing protein [Oscillospiraceae bacterium]